MQQSNEVFVAEQQKKAILMKSVNIRPEVWQS